MGEIADVGALPLHDVPVLLEQGVEFVGQGFELGRIHADEAFRTAFAHVGQIPSHGEQRRQSESDLQHHREHQADTQREQGRRRGQREVSRILIDGSAIFSGHEDDRRRPPAQDPLHGEDAQRLVIRALSIIGHPPARLVAQRLQNAGSRRQILGVEHGARAGETVQSAVSSHFRQLPILAGIGAGRADIGQSRGENLSGRPDGGAGVKVIGVFRQGLVQLCDRGVIERSGQRDPGYDQQGQAPADGGEDQSLDQRSARRRQPFAPAPEPIARAAFRHAPASIGRSR